MSSPVRVARRSAPARTGAPSLQFWPNRRVRRPLDAARLLAAGLALGVLVAGALLVPGALSAIADSLPAAQRGAPRAVLSGANLVASLAVLAILLGVAVDTLRARRFALISAAAAALLGVLGAYAVAAVAGLVEHAAWSVLTAPSDDSAALPIIAVIALVVGADLAHRWMGPARVAISVAGICALALGSLTLPSAAYALLAGLTAGLGIRVSLGVVPARPADEEVRAVLARAGWPVRTVRPVDDVAGRVRYVGVRDDAKDLRVTVVDRDRGGVTLARRGWRLLRMRTAAAGRPALSLRGQLERQALSAALAHAVGVPAPQVLGLLPAGSALVLVERPLAGTPLPRGGPGALRGATEAFRSLRRLHDAGLAHGSPSADSVLLLPDGRAGFAALPSAQPAATDLQRELDVVALLVSLALRIGTDASVEALRTGYDGPRPTEDRLLALLQPLALPPRVRRQVRSAPVLDELRTALAGPHGGSTATAPLRLERLRPRTALSVVGGTVAAYVLASQLSRVSIASDLRTASVTWLLVALAGSAVTYVGSALARQAFAPVAVPLVRTMLVQLASSFLTLVTPPSVGHLALNIRYFHRAGAPTAVAAGSLAVSEAVTVVVTVVVLLVCGWLSGASPSRLALLPRGDVLAVLVGAAAVLAVVAAIPWTRRLLLGRVQPLLRRTLPQLLATASDPRRLATAVAGVLMLNAGYVVALDASLRAFSASLAVPALVVVYLAASALGSAAPTPGGLGAVEAALVGGLTTTGVPVAQALPAVLAFRTVTFWLPAPIGWVAFVALQRRRRI